MRRILLLGSTGSIGTQTIELVRAHPGRFSVVGLAAGSDAGGLAAQAEALGVPASATALGAADAVRLIEDVECDVVVNGITGSAGLAPTLAALGTGATLALANKESLVVGGELVMAAAAPGQIVPVDSEHSAIAQCLAAGRADEVRRLVLTASGGPFHGWDRARLASVTPADALAHPTWSMGRVISTNSATLMNKGHEVIEAHALFGVPLDDVAVTVHRQSIVHSMVEFVDGSTIAQCSPPDMALAIALALDGGARVPDAVAPLDWTRASTWTFEPVDDDGPLAGIRLSRAAAARGGTAPAVLNAANEQAVHAFLDGRIGFLDVLAVVERVLDAHDAVPATLAAIAAAESWARSAADAQIAASAASS
ncbi:1-deoxy-D-xylulose-5-phosphate reductoisomerase [Agrococcus jejuensis]|uniref:1-deoxy-D-xylulose 5-phosphate reductoisomerase n=1 Tax=Agrococcus jejuensis TaxID=399736 RepID=A0A1G8AUE1_9MICO|nr:1-deoxy-D-xylulose-5-phosphate reductoisomerase [Agrococcus jejuensis]SDH23950.1 1-deoxy-D-xylulose 5-phosphate reductoisomerase [Agrococcus jejuensis]